MEIVELAITRLKEAEWNPNRMDSTMTARLRQSIRRFGMLGVLVVRPMAGDTYEVLSGNQRLSVLRDMGFSSIPCLIVELDDANARLLAQALNHIEGSDDLGLKAALVKEVLKVLPQQDVLALLPESAVSLQSLSSLGEIDMAAHLRVWQQAQAARLRHLTFQLSAVQLEVVEEVLEQVMAGVTDDSANPNRRGNALYWLCLKYLELMGGNTP